MSRVGWLLVGLCAGCELQLEPLPADGEVSVEAAPTPKPAPTPEAPGASLVDAMRGRPIAYTDHARCRMDCRNVNRHDITQALAHGRLEPDRSRDDGRCPSHALRWHDDDPSRDLRVVFAACDDVTLVVTAIDLDHDHRCHCD